MKDSFNQQEKFDITFPTYKSYWSEYIREGICDLKFLPINKGGEKLLSVSYLFYSDLTISAQDKQLQDGLEFLKISFKYFWEKYKKEYDFHEPSLVLAPERLQLFLNFSMRKKKLNDIISNENTNKP